MEKCIFLDRDGVLNEERGDYTYRLEDFRIPPGVVESLQQLREQGYLLLVITNQAGISKGLYSREEMHACHNYFQEQCGGLISHFYYSPYHPTVSESLGRKPGSLLFEKAISKFNIDPQESWMIGDRDRDLIPARKLGMATILIGTGQFENSPAVANLQEATKAVLGLG